MRFSDLIVDELIKGKIIDNRKSVQSVSLFPPSPYDNYDCSVRISSKCISKEKQMLIKNSFVYECHIVGNYLNILFDLDKLFSVLYSYVFDKSRKYGFERNKYTDSEIAVEHTSITPVYPINLATFRSSAIGEALKNLMLFWGAKVKTHFFVENLARQLELLDHGFRKANVNLEHLSKGEKIDHVLGSIFVLAYIESHPFSPATNKLKSMFPLSKVASLNNNVVENQENNKDYLCKKCMQGIKETLIATGIEIDCFDLESNFIDNIIPGAFKEPIVIQDLLDNAKKIPYYLRNCAYFSKMVSEYDYLFTIISDRQRATINDTLDALVENSNIYAVFFGDVLISDDDETNALDSIKEGIFHSVDQYISVMTNLYNVSPNVIIDALKFKILSTKLGKGCYIDDSSIDQYDGYFNMIGFFKRYADSENEQNCITCNDQEERTLIMQTIKRIIQFEDVVSKLQNDFSFHHLTEYIQVLYSDMVAASMKGHAIYFDKLKRTIMDIIKTSFRILDIQI